MRIERKYSKKIIIPFVTMADIAFLLLIFLIITSSVYKKSEIRLDLPVSAQFDEIEKNNLTEIYVMADNKIIYNNEEVDLKHLFNILSESKKAVINGDEESDFRVIYKIMNMLREKGYEKVSFAVKRKSTEPGTESE